MNRIILGILSVTVLIGSTQASAFSKSTQDGANVATHSTSAASEKFLPKDRAYADQIQTIFDSLLDPAAAKIVTSNQQTLDKIDLYSKDLSSALDKQDTHKAKSLAAKIEETSQAYQPNRLSGQIAPEVRARDLSRLLIKLADAEANADKKDSNPEATQQMLQAAFRLNIGSAMFDSTTLNALEKLTHQLAAQNKIRLAACLWKEVVTYIDSRNRPVAYVDTSIVSTSTFTNALEKFGKEIDRQNAERRANGETVKELDRVEVEEQLKALEKNPVGHEQELCNLQLAMAKWYYFDANLDKTRTMIVRALDYLESAQGTVDGTTSQSLLIAVNPLIDSKDNNDKDIVLRSYVVLEKKEDGGCPESALRAIYGPKLVSANSQGEQAVKVLGRLLEIREEREDAHSANLDPILYYYVSACGRQGAFDKAIDQQKRRIDIMQRTSGTGGDKEIIATAELAGLCINAGQFDQAESNIVAVLALTTRRQSAATLKSQVADQFGTLADTYRKKDKLEGADSILRKGIELSDTSTAPGTNHVSLSTAINGLVDKYIALGQKEKASSLLQFVVDTKNFGAEDVKTNAWRYQLAQLYLDESNGAPSNADELRKKSQTIFDRAQEFSKNNTMLTTPKVTSFIKERKEALMKYGLTKEASALAVE